MHSAKRERDLQVGIRIDRSESIETDHVCCIDGLKVTLIWEHQKLTNLISTAFPELLHKLAYPVFRDLSIDVRTLPANNKQPLPQLDYREKQHITHITRAHAISYLSIHKHHVSMNDRTIISSSTMLP